MQLGEHLHIAGPTMCWELLSGLLVHTHLLLGFSLQSPRVGVYFCRRKNEQCFPMLLLQNVTSWVVNPLGIFCAPKSYFLILPGSSPASPKGKERERKEGGRKAKEGGVWIASPCVLTAFKGSVWGPVPREPHGRLWQVLQLGTSRGHRLLCVEPLLVAVCFVRR